MKKIPVNIISGFLGAGKTTAILQLLAQKSSDESWAIVVNEFGKVSIDGQTLQAKSIVGSVFDISGGCICCSAKLYLKENLEKIVAAGKFNRIVIEPSGLGGIEMVSEMVGLIPELELMPVICVVDITILDNPKFRRIPIYNAQIRMSDRIVFSKCDMLDSPVQQDELVVRFKSLFQHKYVFFLGSEMAISVLDSPDSEGKVEGRNSQNHLSPAYHLTDGNFQEQVFQYNANRIFAPEALKTVFSAIPFIIRAKGHIRTLNGWSLFNYTLTGCNFDPCPEKGHNELVLIFDRPEIRLAEDVKGVIEKAIISVNT